MPIHLDFAAPAMKFGALPLIGAVVITALIRLALGANRGALLANAAAPLGFAAVYLFAFGLPAWPPRLAGDVLFLVALGGAVLGAGLDLARASKGLTLIGLIAWPTAILTWLSTVQNAGPGGGSGGWRLPVVIGVGVLAFIRLDGERDSGPAPAIMVAGLALGVALLAHMGAAATTALLALGVAAAVTGHMVWNWPAGRYPFGAPMLFGAGGAVTILAAIALFRGAIAPLPLALLTLILFTDSWAAKVQVGTGGVARAMAPLVHVILCLIPIGLAAAIAILIAG